MRWAVFVAAVFWIVANCDAADDLKTLINDAANDSRMQKETSNIHPMGMNLMTANWNWIIVKILQSGRDQTAI